MGGGGIGDQPPPSSSRPSPPPTSIDALFSGVSSASAGNFGFSPGPMTLVSNFFNDDFKSFSQLLAGAMPSDGGSALKHNRPSLHHQSPMFMLPSELLPASQVSAQAIQVNGNPLSSVPAASSMAKQAHQILPDSGTSSSMKECPDDGFNWRKYGQKQVKGSEFPRSYYKCTHLNCPVKKKVERSVDDDHVVAIIYKGQHNHQALRPTNSNENSNNNNVRGGTATWESSTGEHEVAEGSSESEEAADNEMEEKNNDEPEIKRRRNTTEGMAASEGGSSHRAAMEPRIIVQTTSEVDLLDDGYRWRKYGQKVVKGNPFPRSYYKCTSTGCKVRKHVERACSDPKAVITTYEGKHNHDVPAAKTNSHTLANNNNNSSSHLRPHTSTLFQPPAHTQSFNGGPLGPHHHHQQQQQPVARLRLKEEQIT